VVGVPLFIAESVPPGIRGRMVIVYQISTTTGILVAYFVDLGFAGSKDWEAMLAMSAVASFIALAVVASLPDTPRWYMMKGCREEALAVLRRNEHEDLVQAEMAQLEEDLSHQDSAGFRGLFRRPFTRAAIFALGLGFLVQITGINAIVYYSPTILQEVGFKTADGAIVGTVILQAAAIAVELVAFGIVDRVGRRPVILGGIAAMIAADALLLAVYANGHFAGPVAALAFTGFMLFHMGYSFGFGSLGWVYASETFPARLRSSGAAAQLTMNNLANLIVAVFYLSAVQRLGGVGTWALLGSLAIVAFAFVFRLAPEAKGRRLEEIRAFGLDRFHLFGNSWGGWLALSYVLSHPDRGVSGLILSSCPPDTGRFVDYCWKLRAELPAATAETLTRHERAGWFQCPEYQAAVWEFYRRHLCRLRPWPRGMELAFERMGTEVYEAMWGPSEFGPLTGVLNSWSVADRLGEIRSPVLVTAGRYDEASPEQCREMSEAVPDGRFRLFEESSHVAFYEERSAYISCVRGFLREHEPAY
jgi:SP family galactose:H+ symporter-like MFS transporter